MRPDVDDDDHFFDRHTPEAFERERATESVTLFVTDEEFERIGRECCAQTLAVLSPTQYATIGRNFLITVGGWYLHFVNRAGREEGGGLCGTGTANRPATDANDPEASQADLIRPSEATYLVN